MKKFVRSPKYPKVSGPNLPADDHGKAIGSDPIELDESRDVVQRAIAEGAIVEAPVETSEPFEGELVARLKNPMVLPAPVGLLNPGALLKITPANAAGLLRQAEAGNIELLHPSDVPATARVVEPPPPIETADITRHRRELARQQALREILEPRILEILAKERAVEAARAEHAFRNTKVALIRAKAKQAHDLADAADVAALQARAARARADRAAALASETVPELAGSPPPPVTNETPEEAESRKAAWAEVMRGQAEARAARLAEQAAAPTEAVEAPDAKFARFLDAHKQRKAAESVAK